MVDNEDKLVDNEDKLVDNKDKLVDSSVGAGGIIKTFARTGTASNIEVETLSSFRISVCSWS